MFISSLNVASYYVAKFPFGHRTVAFLSVRTFPVVALLISILKFSNSPGSPIKDIAIKELGLSFLHFTVMTNREYTNQHFWIILSSVRSAYIPPLRIHIRTRAYFSSGG